MSAAPPKSAPVMNPASRSEEGRKRRHRIYITAGAVVAIAAVLFLAAHGFSYYLSDPATRALSPRHAELRPSGTLSRPLGIAGGLMLLLMYLYPLRKRWKWLSRKGKTKHWLDYHILMGLSAPAIITFHSAFKFRGIAGAAYWSMMAVVLSGIVGRYLYSKIPRRLDEAEMTLDEMEKTRAELAAQVEAQSSVPPEYLRSLMTLPSMEEVRRMPLPKALILMGSLDLRRGFRRWKLLLTASAHVRANSELRRALDLVSRQAALSKDILFLSRLRQLFHLWHVVHRPFSISLAVMAILHISVVTFFGY